MEGTPPPRDTSRGPSPSSAAVAGHSFIHSPAISTPSPDCPPPEGWRFPSGPRKGQPLSSKRVCSGARLPGRQRGAVPGRLGRTHPSGPSPSDRLGPVSQPRDLFHSNPRRKESSCSWARGREAGQAGGDISGGTKNCGLCPMKSWGPAGRIICGRQSQWMKL